MVAPLIASISKSDVAPVLGKKRYGDIAFIKIYNRGRKIIREALDCSRYDVLDFLIWKMKTSDNTVSVSREEISEGSGVPERTVTRIMARFEKFDLVVRQGHKKWIVNPFPINRVDEDKDRYLMKTYYEAKEK